MSAEVFDVLAIEPAIEGPPLEVKPQRYAEFGTAGRREMLLVDAKYALLRMKYPKVFPEAKDEADALIAEIQREVCGA